MAILAHEDHYGNYISYILEDQKGYYVDGTPSRLIDQACISYGSSLEGRQMATQKVCGYTHKIPISIEPMTGMYFLPTISPSSPSCSWINHTHVSRVKRFQNKNYKSEIIFHNGDAVILDISYGSLVNQVYRTAQLRFLMEKQFKQLRNKD